MDELSAEEVRVLGCLIEKEATTPEQYPLTLNSLTLACNQATNRDPVTRYDDDTVFRAAQRLCTYGLARLASGHSSRATKYRHLAEEGLSLNREQLAVLAVLLLRGPQTPGELKARSERMAPVQSLADIERLLAELDDLGYARRLGRRPGQKEDRFVQLLGGEDGAAAADDANSGFVASETFAPVPADAGLPPAGITPPPAPAPAPAGDPELESRVTALEEEVANLRAQLEELLS